MNNTAYNYIENINIKYKELKNNRIFIKQEDNVANEETNNTIVFKQEYTEDEIAGHFEETNYETIDVKTNIQKEDEEDLLNSEETNNTIFIKQENDELCFNENNMKIEIDDEKFDRPTGSEDGKQKNTQAKNEQKKTPKRRKAFTIEEKGAIISRLEAGESNFTLAKEFGVGHSTISMMNKNKNKIKNLFKLNVLKPKRIRKSTQNNMEQALLEWFKSQTNRGIPVSCSMLLEKANIFALQFNTVDFTCTPSWINRFKVRNNIVSGKSTSLSQDKVNHWLTSVWPILRKQFSDDEIFNADETGFFYKLKPDKTLKFKGETCKDGRLSTERMTILVAANMTGTIKKKLLVIGKYQRPKCFSSIRSLPVDYENNRRAWMTSEIFGKWVRDWDRDLTNNKKRILLLVDNCPAHPPITGLNSITIVFLPPNITSVLQPMNQGIIRALKTNFRKNLVLKTIEHNDGDIPAKLTILDAILLIYDAWNNISQNTIYSCYKRAGFGTTIATQSSQELYEQDTEFDVDDDIPLPQSLISSDIWDDYVDVDNNIVTCEELTDENIVKKIIDEQRGSDDDEEQEEVWNIPSALEALKAADIMNQYVHCNIDNDKIKSAMSCLHNAIRDSYYNSRKNS